MFTGTRPERTVERAATEEFREPPRRKTKMRYTLLPATLGAATLVFGALNQNAPLWKSSLRMVQEDRISESPDSVRSHGSAFGTAVWKYGDNPSTSVVELTFTYGGQERDLSWAILFGRCRSASLPVAPVSSFPELNMTGGGRVQVEARLATELPHRGQYHVEVYKDREGGEQAVVACGEFKYSEKG
jgi:hypothetical protein